MQIQITKALNPGRFELGITELAESVYLTTSSMDVIITHATKW